MNVGSDFRSPRALIASLPLVLLCAASAVAQTHITDAEVDLRLRAVEEAFRGGRVDEAANRLRDPVAWADHIRDVRDHPMAERIYQRVLETLGRTFGSDHPHAVQPLVGLAALYAADRRHAEAEPLLRRALIVAERTAGPEHFAVGRILRDLGAVSEGQGQMTEAEASYRRALPIFEKLPPPRNAEADTVRERLARVLRATDRQTEATEVESQMSPARRAADAADRISVEITAAQAAWRANRPAEAERRLKTALQEADAANHQGAIRVSLRMLAILYRATGRLADAEATCNRLATFGESCPH